MSLRSFFEGLSRVERKVITICHSGSSSMMKLRAHFKGYTLQLSEYRSILCTVKILIFGYMNKKQEKILEKHPSTIYTIKQTGQRSSRCPNGEWPQPEYSRKLDIPSPPHHHYPPSTLPLHSLPRRTPLEHPPHRLPLHPLLHRTPLEPPLERRRDPPSGTRRVPAGPPVAAKASLNSTFQ